jgi:hypothetical protein
MVAASAKCSTKTCKLLQQLTRAIRHPLQVDILWAPTCAQGESDSDKQLKPLFCTIHGSVQNEQQKNCRSTHLLTTSGGDLQQAQRSSSACSVAIALHTDELSAVTPTSACFYPCSHFTLQATPYQRADYSHSTTKLMKIAHDNQLLVKRLTSISHKVRHVAAQPCSSKISIALLH